jgi:hypothetical protein
VQEEKLVADLGDELEACEEGGSYSMLVALGEGGNGHTQDAAKV